MMINSGSAKENGLKDDEFFIFLAASVEATATTLACLTYLLTKYHTLSRNTIQRG